MVAETPWKGLMEMIRRRIYNPAHLTPEELKESFVAREDTLAELLRVIREQTTGRPCQHMMLIGARGMGKTTLGLRFLYAIEDDPDLSERWQPVAFHEESYGIVNLADFWIHALRHLTRATGESRWEDRAEALIRDEGDQERAAAYALAELTDCSRESGKRLILFVENLDAVIGQIHDEREIHSLRATLIERSEILLLGSANAFFEAIGGYGEPLYEFFRVFKLEGIGQEEACRILEAAASSEGRSEVSNAIDLERGRLETIRRLTGGNPRLLSLACRLLIESPIGSAIEDLERLIDEQTPYFKARIEDLPGQARKVFHCLAEGWKPLLAKEVAAAARLSSSHASAQLRQLVEKGYAREVQLPRSTRTRYDVGDRFYNIYYLLRFSRSGRGRLERLVEFLQDVFGSAGMRMMYGSALATLRTNGAGTSDVYDLLGVLARQVAADYDFTGRYEWQQSAVDIIVDRFGPESALISEIEGVFAHSRTEDGLHEHRMAEVDVMFRERRFCEADRMLRKALEHRRQDASIWLLIGTIMLKEHRFDEVLSFLESASRTVTAYHDKDWNDLFYILKCRALLGLDRKSEALSTLDSVRVNPKSVNMTERSRISAALSLEIKGVLLIDLQRSEGAIQVLLRTLDYIREDDGPMARRVAVRALVKAEAALVELKRNEQAITVRERLAGYVHSDDSEDLRRSVVVALSLNTKTLNEMDRSMGTRSLCDLILDLVATDDSPAMRQFALLALRSRLLSASTQGEYEHLATIDQMVVKYVRNGDPKWLLTVAAVTLTLSGRILIGLQRYVEAEDICRLANEVDQEHSESWSYRALSVFLQANDRRTSEAEMLAKRAVELNPPAELHYTLFLTCCLSEAIGRNHWTDSNKLFG